MVLFHQPRSLRPTVPPKKRNLNLPLAIVRNPLGNHHLAQLQLHRIKLKQVLGKRENLSKAAGLEKPLQAQKGRDHLNQPHQQCLDTTRVVFHLQALAQQRPRRRNWRRDLLRDWKRGHHQVSPSLVSPRDH